MADEVTVEELADTMYKLVADAAGKKKLKPMDLTKAMMENYGRDRCSKPNCKAAIKSLIDSGRCVYTYFGGSFVELPSKEGE